MDKPRHEWQALFTATVERVLQELIAGRGKEIGRAADEGDIRAQRVIEAYRLLYADGGDPGAQGVLVASYEEWLKKEERHA